MDDQNSEIGFSASVRQVGRWTYSVVVAGPVKSPIPELSPAPLCVEFGRWHVIGHRRARHKAQVEIEKAQRKWRWDHEEEIIEGTTNDE